MKSLPRILGFAAFGILGFHLSQVSAKPDPDPAAGMQAYQDNCVRCHGLTGAGDGRDAKRMDPRPRPLAEGIFKFRTTASGTPPTDEDLFRTLSEGLPGSRMPEFQRLSEETRWQLVYYVKSLSSVFQEQQPEPIDLGTDLGPDKANLARGKGLYTQLGCNACHGNLGRGNGPSAPTLVDQWNRPIQAADLTQGWSYRGGPTPRDILTRLMTGIDGTPMPSYAEAVSAAEVWDLAYYVHSLQEKPQWGRSIEAVKVEGALPEGLDDSVWHKAPRTDVRLSSIFYRAGEIVPSSANAISAQAVYNENEILLRLSWHDRSENRQTPWDAVGLVLLPDRKLKWRIGSLRSWPPAVSADLALDLIYWSADQDSAREALVQNMTELEGSKEAGQPLKTEAFYADGEWVLLVKRPLQTPLASGATLASENPTLFGLMVWDGEKAEQGRQRSSSQWLDLILKK